MAYSWARPRGAQLQLGTLSTRIALYTRRWRASSGVLTHADYTIGAVAPLLAYAGTPAVLRTAHLIGPGGPLPHAKNEVDRTTRCRDMAKRSADRQTDWHVLPPSNQPISQPFCQYPAVAGNFRSLHCHVTLTFDLKTTLPVTCSRNFRTKSELTTSLPFRRQKPNHVGGGSTTLYTGTCYQEGRPSKVCKNSKAYINYQRVPLLPCLHALKGVATGEKQPHPTAE